MSAVLNRESMKVKRRMGTAFWDAGAMLGNRKNPADVAPHWCRRDVRPDVDTDGHRIKREWRY